MTVPRKYRCSFCNKEFVRESWYKKHECDKKKRFRDKNRISHVQAHRLFNHWQDRAGLLRRGKVKEYEEFCKSPYFNTFLKLAELIEDSDVISGYKYVDWLVDHRVKEPKWLDKNGLEKFRDYTRRTELPKEQVEKTCEFILEWCEKKSESPVEFFRRITPGQALNMVRKNQLSPWVLLCYDHSVEELIPRFNGEVLFALDDHIKINYWLDKIDRNEDSVEVVKDICKEKLDDRITQG